MLSLRLASWGTGARGGVCPLKGGGRVFCPECPGGGGRRGGQVVPRIAVTCPGSQGTSCPCSPFMIRVEVPGLLWGQRFYLDHLYASLGGGVIVTPSGIGCAVELVEHLKKG